MTGLLRTTCELSNDVCRVLACLITLPYRYDDYLYDSNDPPSSDDHKRDAPAVEAPKVVPAPNPISIAQPRPGYAAPIAALNLAQQAPVASRGQPSPRYDISPRSTPHPLQPPSSPIVPVFAAPKAPDNVRFVQQSSVMRGQSEETLIPRQNNDFWRRFSMVAKEESSKPYEQRKRYEVYLIYLVTYDELSPVVHG
jgi:hypothetical protein